MVFTGINRLVSVIVIIDHTSVRLDFGITAGTSVEVESTVGGGISADRADPTCDRNRIMESHRTGSINQSISIGNGGDLKLKIPYSGDRAVECCSRSGNAHIFEITGIPVENSIDTVERDAADIAQRLTVCIGSKSERGG